MKTLALLIGLTLLCSCADVSPNYNAYLEALKHHDTEQAKQVATTVAAIRSTAPTRGFQTQAESAMFSVIQAMLIERVKYTPIGLAAPRTGYDLLSNITVPILQLVNPWLLWWVADNDSGTSRSGNSAYNSGGGDILVNSANAGSQNTGSAISFDTQTTNFKTEDYCLTCDDDGDLSVNPVVGEPGYECSEGEMVTPQCSCATRQAGGC